MRRRQEHGGRRLAVVAASVTLMAALSGCGDWNPWNATPSGTAMPTESVATTDPPTPTPEVEPSPTLTPPSSSSATAATLGPLSGIWIGEWTNEKPVPGSGTFTIRWGQQGDQLFGTISIAGSNCLTSGNVTGTVSGTRLRFGAVERPTAGGVSIEYEATITGPDTLIGTYESDCGPSEGTWRATRTGEE